MNDKEIETPELDACLDQLQKETNFFRREGIVIAFQYHAETLEQHIHDGTALNAKHPFPDQSYFNGYQQALFTMMKRCKEIAKEFKGDME